MHEHDCGNYAKRSDIKNIVQGCDALYKVGKVKRVAYFEQNKIVVIDKPSSLQFFRAMMERCYDKTNDSKCELLELEVWDWEKIGTVTTSAIFYRDGAVEVFEPSSGVWLFVN